MCVAWGANHNWGELQKRRLAREGDRPVPPEYAHAQYEAAINSSRSELKFFTREEGGSMHASADNMAVATSFISDWVQSVLIEGQTRPS